MTMDNSFHKMAPEGLKVMRLANAIVVAILVILALIAFIVSFFVSFKEALWWISGGTLVLAILYAIVFVWLKPVYAYHVFGYQYAQEGIIVREGFIFVQETKVPLFRIQNIDIEEGFIMRKYQLATLTFSTAGGNTEIKLIDKQQAMKIKQFIQHGILDDDANGESEEATEINKKNYDKIKNVDSNNEEDM